MAKRFEPVIRRARFAVSGYSPEAMLEFGNVLNSSIADRMSKGLTINDSAAPPLKEQYARYKQRRTGSRLRDLYLTGRTRRSMKVLQVQTNRAVLGFTDPEAEKRIAINSRISRQYGVSPSDKAKVLRAMESGGHSAVTVRAA